jgi:hypothetical protein
MQPEVAEKIKAINEVTAPNKRQPSPIEQWDILAFKAIGNELVPKGFKKQKNGKYRGTEYVETTKKAVIRTQKVAAQLIRGFRDKTRKELEELLTLNKAQRDQYTSDWSKTPWYKFKQKRHNRRRGEYYHGVVDALEDAIETLGRVNIK